ncbi:MAG: MgtC/SapB family protein [bacterium]|nr:MgtC/SapB family protein [bacterium]MDT8396930.1 MgtC/SapB family protein [bacterium]
MFFGDSYMGSYELALLVKLGLAALAGVLVGLEREKHGRPAGMRTNLLVSVGACTIMIISEAFYIKYGMYGSETALRLDPSRTAAQIITGIGFLGAGVIIKEGPTVRGLTTAASLWVVAGLGMAFGMGFFSLGALSTVLVIVSLIFLRKLDPIVKKNRFLTMSVTGVRRANLYDELMDLVKGMGLKASDISSQVDLVENEIFIKMVLTQQQKRIGQEVTAAVERLEGIKKIFYS